MKKCVLVVLAAMMLFLIVACPEKEPETQPAQTTTPPETTDKTTLAATSAPSATLTPTGLPNMVFTKPAGWSGNIIAGTGEDVADLPGDKDLYVAAWLANSGGTDVRNPSVALYINSIYVKNIKLEETIPPGEGVLVYARLKDLEDTVPVIIGHHEFIFIADSAQLIEESDETDNKIKATVEVSFPAFVPGPDIKPALVDGTAPIVVDHQDGSYRDIRIRVGVTNTGATHAEDVITVELKNGSTRLYTWTLDSLKLMEQAVLEVTIAEILEKSSITAGIYNLTLDCEVASEPEKDIGNNSVTVKNLRIALSPFPKAVSIDDTGKKIQAAINNSTWYGEEETQDMMDLTRELLEGVYTYWSNLRIYIMTFDEYNERYANKFGDTEAERENLKNQIANDRIRGQRYIEGYIDGATMYFREGTLLQILPNLIYEIGELLYAQKNFGGYRTSLPMRGNDFASNLLQAYVIAKMCEEYGFRGYINMSVLLGDITHTSIGGSGWDSVNLRRVWAIATEAGYPEGGAPAQVFLDAFNDFTGDNDPIAYLEDLDNKANLLDNDAIVDAIRWRLVDKELTMLPSSVVKKIDPSLTGLSLDSLVSYQSFIPLPF